MFLFVLFYIAACMSMAHTGSGDYQLKNRKSFFSLSFEVPVFAVSTVNAYNSRLRVSTNNELPFIAKGFSCSPSTCSGLFECASQQFWLQGNYNVTSISFTYKDASYKFSNTPPGNNTKYAILGPILTSIGSAAAWSTWSINNGFKINAYYNDIIVFQISKYSVVENITVCNEK